MAKLKFRLAAPTPAYHLHHLIAVEEEKDWSDDLSRHMVEIILEDHVLAREKPSKIAHAVYEAIKVRRIQMDHFYYIYIIFRVLTFLQCRSWKAVVPSVNPTTQICGARNCSRCVSREFSRFWLTDALSTFSMSSGLISLH